MITVKHSMPFHGAALIITDPRRPGECDAVSDALLAVILSAAKGSLLRAVTEYQEEESDSMIQTTLEILLQIKNLQELHKTQVSIRHASEALDAIVKEAQDGEYHD